MTRPRSVLPPPMVLLLVAMVAFLAPLAYASPADPTWIVGAYDAGDSDAALLFLDSMSGTPADWSEDAMALARASADLTPASSVSPDRLPLACVGRGPPPA